MKVNDKNFKVSRISEKMDELLNNFIDKNKRRLRKGVKGINLSHGHGTHLASRDPMKQITIEKILHNMGKYYA